MPRTDRLYDLIQILRDGRLHRAQDLADRLGVSLRTIYRDMDTLMASGVPLEGNRGLGYRATADMTLPPLNLTMAELEALHLGLAVVNEAGDAELGDAARSLSAKIDAILPEDRSAPPSGWGAAVYPFAQATLGFQHHAAIRAAIRARQKLRLMTDDGPATGEIVRPLHLEYWGRLWMMTAWSETDGDFRTIRLDTISQVVVLPQLFVEEEGKSLADFRSRQGSEKRNTGPGGS
ncbi:HTH domain-containing protein [Ponticoccus sp. SC2-23]|uniref:helix-turn-helix transcriptional regulator n=1 Tax=Alexandriicola marinus TaxID=2081710 RepID=UPI000FDACCE6|nr:HTH domain-containing protein [Alexandriicola marinus]MBM1219378.1 HTH domain-containing protein [Ponticoccus sp. SC6-9]MBM1223550.1 HTH domain-containing protein [Ponticoccus sp. SC6-15]MBM1229191.1 HTH domain-containing protein [Ponticoccus sp. SC6-38]MBM1232516.1 HTH domain-containing protein [Ponticoccus sp. SC6-45]MBM1237534.1 HTH domain-containing protein [Ponticoccus sp. SC6-49]MBM1241527.1 HTH domain-containing protein [Ponticoccus sp. SC2-64]MBM1246040.1 HTH domain-containing pro